MNYIMIINVILIWLLFRQIRGELENFLLLFPIQKIKIYAGHIHPFKPIARPQRPPFTCRQTVALVSGIESGRKQTEEQRHSPITREFKFYPFLFLFSKIASQEPVENSNWAESLHRDEIKSVDYLVLILLSPTHFLWSYRSLSGKFLWELFVEPREMRQVLLENLSYISKVKTGII